MRQFAKPLTLFLLVTLLATTKTFAITWDEPWAKQVISESTSFVLAKVVSTIPEKGIKIRVIQNLGGELLPDTLTITGFYLLDICSSTGNEGPRFRTRPVDGCYLFIKKDAKGAYCIATPSTGFDYVNEGRVIATYRHSYHQASVPVSIYEKTMTAIFNNYHGKPYDKAYIDQFVQENLQKKPAGFDEKEINTFFLQHVALECVYHLQLNIQDILVIPFLNDKENFHNQVSAARAMSAINTATSKKELMNAIADTSRNNFVRVMCIWSLAELKPAEFKAQLQQLEPDASDESDGFGGNIMDSRVCTHVPSVKAALKDLVGKL